MIADISVFEVNQFCSFTQLSLLGDWEKGKLLFINRTHHQTESYSPESIRDKLRIRQRAKV